MHRRSSGDSIDARFVELARALFLAVEVDDVIAVTREGPGAAVSISSRCR